MTTQEVIALAKEKLGKDITEQEAQNYIDGKAAIPDDALDLVSGGGECYENIACPNCGSTDTIVIRTQRFSMFAPQTISTLQCQNCGREF